MKKEHMNWLVIGLLVVFCVLAWFDISENTRLADAYSRCDPQELCSQVRIIDCGLE